MDKLSPGLIIGILESHFGAGKCTCDPDVGHECEVCWFRMAAQVLRAALPVEEKGPRPVEAETVANQISDARNTYIEGFMAGWGDNVNQDVLILAMKAWDSSESRAEVEAASRPQEEGKAVDREG